MYRDVVLSAGVFDKHLSHRYVVFSIGYLLGMCRIMMLCYLLGYLIIILLL